MQVSLGFVEDYTLIPPRGAIISGKPKPWLTMRHLQTAFISARLCFMEPQLIVLRGLVHAFSQQYASLYPATAQQQGQQGQGVTASTSSSLRRSTRASSGGAVGAGSGGAEKKPPVFGPTQTLSAYWLKKYLVHLRLTKKTSVSEGNLQQQMRLQGVDAGGSITGASTAVLAAGTSTIASGSVGGNTAGEASSAAAGGGGGGATAGAADRPPMLFNQWLNRKMKSELKRDTVKPIEFEKSLNGQPHVELSKEDIEAMLQTYNIVPAEVMKKEIECRIQSWLLDTDGRRDFQHELNVKIRNWISSKKVDTKKLPANERGYWQIWQRMPEEEKKTEKAAMLNKMIEKKRAELQAQESEGQVITKELYWKFAAEAQNSKTVWSTWLDKHISNFQRTLEDFCRTDQERQQKLSTKENKLKAVASLNEVQNKLKKVQDTMDSYHQIELQKALVALRRTALSNGIEDGKVITKEDFDRHIKSVLCPYVVLDDPAQEKAFGLVFHEDVQRAVSSAKALESEKEDKSKKGFQAWLEEKTQQREKLLQEQVMFAAKILRLL
jgi:hypothetical protein